MWGGGGGGFKIIHQKMEGLVYFQWTFCRIRESMQLCQHNKQGHPRGTPGPPQGHRRASRGNCFHWHREVHVPGLNKPSKLAMLPTLPHLQLLRCDVLRESYHPVHSLWGARRKLSPSAQSATTLQSIHTPTTMSKPGKGSNCSLH